MGVVKPIRPQPLAPYLIGTLAKGMGVAKPIHPQPLAPYLIGSVAKGVVHDSRMGLGHSAHSIQYGPKAFLGAPGYRANHSSPRVLGLMKDLELMKSCDQDEIG
uniref:Uncharacterized protein n=1 Tax=Oryza punctata TaxID=4537 RepID=A0A0E0MET9_ORYPU